MIQDSNLLIKTGQYFGSDTMSQNKNSDHEDRIEVPYSYVFIGGVLGFSFYWLAFVMPFIIYGLNTPLFLLYTWPFFLALMPLSVLIGIGIHKWVAGSLLISVPLCAVIVIMLFWQTFSLLTGW